MSQNTAEPCDPLIASYRAMSFETLIDQYKTQVHIIGELTDREDAYENGNAGKKLMIAFFTALKMKLVIRDRLPKVKAAIDIANTINLNDLRTWY